jgi:hypothetical protein
MIINIEQGRRLGIRGRSRRPGPEKDLVDWFLDDLPFAVPSNLRLTVFEEPRLQSGFPDLVLVLWDENITQNWNPNRADLTVDDIKLLHFLHRRGQRTLRHLEKSLMRTLTKSIERLEKAEVIVSTGALWKAIAPKEIFAVKQLIAIEAKIDNFSAGLEQSFLNTWFASQSFLLVPHVPNREIFDRAISFDLGIWSKKSGMMNRPSDKHVLPRSYASWLFNEWAWKAMRLSHPRNLNYDASRYRMAGRTISRS